MSLMKYQDVLVLCKDKIKEKLAPLRVRQMRKEAELEVCKLESTIAEKEQAIQELTSEYPINFHRVIDAIDDLELTKMRRDSFNNVINELFGDAA